MILGVLRPGLRGLRGVNLGFGLRLSPGDESMQDLGLGECFHVWISLESFWARAFVHVIDIYICIL